VLERETDRLHRMVQGLIRFFRLREPTFETVDLRRVLEDAAGAMAERMRESEILLALDWPGAIEVRGDSGLLREAFDGLMHNACEAMAAGGTLRISGRSAPGGEALVSIEDTGVGIAPDALPRIFDLFYSTKSHAGLGLSIAFRIAQLHGGVITVESNVPAGSRFLVSLPRIEG